MAEVQVIQSKEKLSRPSRRKKRLQQRSTAKRPVPDYKPLVRENENLVKYYSAQPIFNEGEFEEFMIGLKESLPASFRINTFDLDQAKFLRRLVEDPELKGFLAPTPTLPTAAEAGSDPAEDGHINEPQDDKVLESSIADQVAKPPSLEPLCWYPKRFGWQMNFSRIDLRTSPVLQKLHKFLMAETDNGFISRQEAVSMIPPLLLDVHRGQNLLDMCAAPGSKTAQLLEYLKYDIMGSGEPAEPQSNEPFDEGMVVASDVDNKRCYMLVHQSSRLNSPNCIIINQDATRLPDMKTLSKQGDELSKIKFDRVLCDVPCSGDGTVRKNPDVWKKWTVGNANNFHGMQCKILRRGIELLKEDGLLVYSTCSMNPVEDEAVIASILRASKGKVALEDVSHKLPGLKFKPGTSSWVVMGRDMTVIPGLEQVPPEHATQIYPSLFPPTDEEILRKLSGELPWEVSETKANQAESGNVTTNKPVYPNPKKRRFGGFKEDPFIFMDTEDADWMTIKNGYGLSDSFPVGQLVHRCTAGKKRSIYLVSKRTRSFIIANREEPGKADFVKIINGGMRLFSRADTEAGFRICQDGVNEILPYIKDDIKVPLNKDDLIALLKSRTVAIDLLSSARHIRDKIKPGSFILMYRHEEAGEVVEMPLVAWKGEFTIALYVANTYRVHLCALAQLTIGHDFIVQ